MVKFNAWNLERRKKNCSNVYSRNLISFMSYKSGLTGKIIYKAVFINGFEF